MADRMMFISWRESVHGREERALEVFNEALGLYGRMAQEGRIESFEVKLLNPNGDMGGYIELYGTAEQLSTVRESDDFRRNMIDANLITENLRVVVGVCNEGVAEAITMLQEGISRVGAPA